MPLMLLRYRSPGINRRREGSDKPVYKNIRHFFEILKYKFIHLHTVF
jgi:hypothetical protein